MNDEKMGPSWLYYVLAGVVFALGQGFAAAYVIYGVLQLGQGVQRAVVPGTHTLEFAEAGDYTIFHIHTVRHPGDPGMSIIDYFRMEGGKVAEHWEVLQEIPKTLPHDNGVF